MDKYIPDVYKKDIFSIDYELLYKNGIRFILFDLDNTLVTIKDKKPSKDVKELFEKLKKMGFKLLLFSNSLKSRVNLFKDALDVETCAFACKPKPRKFLSIIKIYNLKFSEIAIVGDSMVTDIYGGNNVGITTILVDPISKKEFLVAHLQRKRENKIIKKLRRQNLFARGKYYE